MKRKEFYRVLKEYGFSLHRHGRHEVWSNGERHVSIPGGNEINKMVAKRLLKEIGA